MMQSDERPITDRPAIIGPDAYLSETYARQEDQKLWGKVWQIACREEEIPKVGDYVTYDILNESIIVVRSAPDRISAYFNVCQHRGRRLTEGCGHAKRFVCKFHAWKWNLDGENVDALCREEWEDALTDENLRLKPVQVSMWAGFVFINMDPNCEPLERFLDPVQTWLDPFEIGKMRYRWRQWLHFPCNWKVAIEAFIEGYHIAGTHPQLLQYGNKLTWSEARGKHACMGARVNEGFGGATSGASGAADPRVAIAAALERVYAETNSNTTETLVNAARRLVDELPPETPARDVQMHLMKRAREDDAARGVIWPSIDPSHFAKVGNDWLVFPNSVILQGPTFALCYRARPNGYNPNSCIFDVFHLERFPEGEEPKPENRYVPEITEQAWRTIMYQDFINMEQVQRGMHSRGFHGARPNPVQERAVTQLHKILSDYMGVGAPQAIG